MPPRDAYMRRQDTLKGSHSYTPVSACGALPTEHNKILTGAQITALFPHMLVPGVQAWRPQTHTHPQPAWSLAEGSYHKSRTDRGSLLAVDG